MRGRLARDLALVAIGGAVGSLARFGLSRALPHPGTGLPTATLLVNVLGCALLGWLAAGSTRRDWLRPLLGTGVLGGFTTFSAFALETDRLIQREPAVAAAYLALTVLLGLGAARAGAAAGTHPPRPDSVPV